MGIDERFLSSSGIHPFTGNELLLKGGLEGRVALLTGYPGSPISDIFDSIYTNRDILLRNGVVAQIANNEALAVARLNGARMANLRGMAVMKSVGMHVASDGIAIGNLAESNRVEGGALVVVGDDPWNETTQINSDSRFLAQHLQMPILEPSTFQEIKDWIEIGFELSGFSNLYVAYLITTPQADGGGSVFSRPNQYPSLSALSKTTLSSKTLPLENFVMIPPHTSMRELTLKLRYEKFLQLASQKGLNRTLYFNLHQKNPYSLGFISAGLSYSYLEHALYEMGLSRAFPILKLGVTHPFDSEIVATFLEKVEKVIVIEEKRPFLETQVRNLVQKMAQGMFDKKMKFTLVYGKEFPLDCSGIPIERGINSSLLIQRLGKLFLKMDLPHIRDRKSKIEQEVSLVDQSTQFRIQVPSRTPTFCPGCPHRDSAVVSLKLKRCFSDENWMRENYQKDSEEILFHGESGCHSMLQFAPNEGLMQNYSGMGLGGGTGAGIDPFIQNKQVVFLGDSTFFHSGMVAVSDAIKNRQNILFIVLDNKTTAMTGHQPTPGNDFDILGRKTLAQDIEKVVRGMAEGEKIPVIRANPAERGTYSALLQKWVVQPGVKILIADKECAITYHRRLKKEKKQILKFRGYLPQEEVINITPEVCEYCLECTQATGCPGLTVEETDFGPKIVTDLSTCVSDGACTKGKVCPSFEKIIIRRKKPAKVNFKISESESLPQPVRSSFDETYYMTTFAVGGMGSGVVSALLVRAGLNEGYQVLFSDKKGLAIRNGGVYGTVIYSKNRDQVLAPAVPYGKANLILGVDLIETARGLDPKMHLMVSHPSRTAAIVNRHKTHTISSLMGRESFDPEDLESNVRERTRIPAYFSIDFSEISQKLLGSKLYVNVLMVGAAFQKGFLPLSLESLEKAIRETISEEDIPSNIRAFHLGREIILNPQKFLNLILKEKETYSQILEQKSKILASRLWFGKKISLKYRQMVEHAIRWMHLDEASNRKIALRVYELIQFQDIDFAEQYLSLLWEVYRKDRKEYQATRAAIENLFKVLLIKDEVYVAHLLTCSEKFQRDRERYGIDESNGDRATYIHFNRPQISFWGFELELNLNTSNWMLYIVKYCKFLRRLLPEWHRREKEFRDWYIEIVKRFNFFEEDFVYHTYVELLKVPESVNGYRLIRYPKMEEARKKAEQLLARMDPAAGNRSSSSILS